MTAPGTWHLQCKRNEFWDEHMHGPSKQEMRGWVREYNYELSWRLCGGTMEEEMKKKTKKEKGQKRAAAGESADDGTASSAARSPMEKGNKVFKGVSTYAKGTRYTQESKSKF